MIRRSQWVLCSGAVALIAGAGLFAPMPDASNFGSLSLSRAYSAGTPPAFLRQFSPDYDFPMNPTLIHRSPDSDVAANFWPEPHEPAQNARRARPPSRAAANLYELFVHELSLLLAGACHADRMARVVFVTTPPEQIRLRHLVLGLARSARGCLPALPPALVEAGLVLPPARDHVVEILLRPASPGRCRPVSAASRSVMSARIVSAFSDVARHFEAATMRAAEDARLLGSDRLYHTVATWGAMWSDYLHDLRAREQSFRVQAYAAGLDTLPWRQSA